MPLDDVRQFKNWIRWKFIQLFGYICSLNIYFSLHIFSLLYCIIPCKSLGRFLCATRYIAMLKQASHGMCGSAGLKMPIHAHVSGVINGRFWLVKQVRLIWLLAFDQGSLLGLSTQDYSLCVGGYDLRLVSIQTHIHSILITGKLQ